HAPEHFRLPRRPGMASSAEQMIMQMRHSLAGVGTAIDDNPIPIVQIPLGGQLLYHHQQMPGQRSIAFGQIGQRRNLLLGNDQDVNGRLRINVFESQAAVILVNNLGGNFPVDNPFENRLAHFLKHSGWSTAMASSASKIGISSTIGYSSR